MSDAQARDVAVLWSGVQIVREIASQRSFVTALGQELASTAQIGDQEAVRRNCLHYYHPVGTCKMGPATDSLAVVDAQGKVHGLDNLYVADASIMPVIPRANTNLPTVVLAERVAAWL